MSAAGPEARRALAPAHRLRTPETEPGDGDIVARVLRGDSDSFAILVRRHQEALFRHARGMGLDPDTAADMVQDALVKAYGGLTHCRNPDRFRSWLFRILRNCCLDYLKNVRRRDVSLEDPALGDAAARVQPHDETRAYLGAALGRLSPLLREAFLLRHEAGYTYDEVAEITDASPSAVKMRVHRAREELRAQLLEHGGGM
ncbi:MAG TPA: RNA polymerase sigma factor [Longimicrobiales bacterium]